MGTTCMENIIELKLIKYFRNLQNKNNICIVLKFNMFNTKNKDTSNLHDAWKCVESLFFSINNFFIML